MLNSRAELASMTPEPFVSCSKLLPVLEAKAHLMRVLIAEDDPALASFVRKGLEAEHYAVDVTTDESRRVPWPANLIMTCSCWI